MKEPKYLGKPANEPIDEVDLIEWTGGPMTVRLDCAEFTSLCPITGQPDFGRLCIEYAPDKHIVETKSVKLYLWKFRTERVFNEQVVSSIADDLYDQIRPHWLRVVGRFNRRGGIRVTAAAERGDAAYRPS